jgi:hypothetical protein
VDKALVSAKAIQEIETLKELVGMEQEMEALLG